MKKLLGVLCAILIAAAAVHAETLLIETNVNMENFWEKNGKDTQKVLEVGNRIIKANKLKRAPIYLERTYKIVSASTSVYNKTIIISLGFLPYIDNDDELAAVLSHELAHAQLVYEGAFKILAIKANSKKYEYQADLAGIDYMVKAGYNPIAAIIIANKIFGEPLWDWGFLSTHPKGSKRMLAMYKYIYVKYPQYLTSDMTRNPSYQNFYNMQQFEIQKFVNKYKTRKIKQNEDI